jgi:hypothetical protein
LCVLWNRHVFVGAMHEAGRKRVLEKEGK